MLQRKNKAISGPRNPVGGTGRLGCSLLLALLVCVPSAQAGDEVEVYKSPTCGCCTKWIEHLKANGFAVMVHDQNDMAPIKSRLGVQPQFQSCHTATVGGYVVEGHVPAEDIRRLLKERPDIKGLAAPGMPQGSPGMEGPYKAPYEVVAIGRDDSARTFSKH